MNTRTALLSVYDKTGIVDFARELFGAGWSLLASGGTAKALAAANIPVTDVASLVGGGAILGHRVVTISRELHAGLLATTSDPDLEELEKLGLPFIDLACVDFYPLREETTRDGATIESVIEKTDIGGPTMVRSAAKGNRIVVADPADRTAVLNWLKYGGARPEDFRNYLAAKAECIVADYCLTSAEYRGAGMYRGMIGKRITACKYGENGWQTPAALYETFNPAALDPLALNNFELVQGTPPSYNNYCDVERLLQTITHMAAAMEQNGLAHPTNHYAVAAKHGNPCGASLGSTPIGVLERTVEGDTRAIFGGLIMTSFPIDEQLAELLLTHKQEKGRRLLDGILAPSVSEEALQMLKRKGDKCRILVNPALGNLGMHSLDKASRFRYVRGGFLVQPNYTFVLNLDDPRIEYSQPLDNLGLRRDLALGWAIGSTSNSNTVALTKDGMLIGNGTGQQDRVTAARLAIDRARDAGHDVSMAVAYSDSFFPFPDGPQLLADRGITAIFASSESVNDHLTKQVCADSGVFLVMVPDSLGRGFYGH